MVAYANSALPLLGPEPKIKTYLKKTIPKIYSLKILIIYGGMLVKMYLSL